MGNRNTFLSKQREWTPLGTDRGDPVDQRIAQTTVSQTAAGRVVSAKLLCLHSHTNEGGDQRGKKFPRPPDALPHRPDGAAGRPSYLARPAAAAAPSGGRSGRSGLPFVSPRAGPDLPSWSP
jgi:hypothetical protein